MIRIEDNFRSNEVGSRLIKNKDHHKYFFLDYGLGLALGAQAETFTGMAGLGDLVLTCTDNQSRNRRFGMLLGQGTSVEEAQETISQVVEGYRNTKEVYLLAASVGVEMPIVEQIYQVLYCGKPTQDAAIALLGRERKDETRQ